MDTENPYHVLNLDPECTVDEVKRAFYYIAQIYHPHKGGNEEQFLRFQRAYQQIITARQRGEAICVAPKSFAELKTAGKISVEHQYRPEDFRSSSQKFDRQTFNEKFAQRKPTGESYTYNVDELTARDRDPTQFKREYSEVTTQAENVTPMFRGGFNNQTFNRVFMHMKEAHKQTTGGLEEYQEPQPCTKEISCIDLGDPQGQDRENQYENAYGSHRNPDAYQTSFLSQFKGLPDVTKETALSQSVLRQRVQQYQSQELRRNTDPLVTDQTAPIRDVPGLGSERSRLATLEQQQRLMKKSDVYDTFDRMLALRSPQASLTSVQTEQPEVPEQAPVQAQAQVYRVPSVTYGTPQHQPLPMQWPPVHFEQSTGTRPPMYKKKSSIDDELRRLKRTVRKQQKALELLRK